MHQPRDLFDIIAKSIENESGTVRCNEKLNSAWTAERSLTGLEKRICDTFCDKLDLQKTYTPQGKIGGQKGGFVIDFVIIWKLAENRSQKHDMKE